MARSPQGGSPDGDGGAFPYQRLTSGGIPVRKTDAAMASGSADGIGNGADVDDYARAVQSGPEDADWVVGPGGRLWKSSVRSPRLRTPRSCHSGQTRYLTFPRFPNFFLSICPLSPALRPDPMTLSGASRRKQIPSSWHEFKHFFGSSGSGEKPLRIHAGVHSRTPPLLQKYREWNQPPLRTIPSLHS